LRLSKWHQGIDLNGGVFATAEEAVCFSLAIAAALEVADVSPAISVTGLPATARKQGNTSLGLA